MRIRRNKMRRGREKGVIITLVAVCMLAVVAAMAALSIDVVTNYTTRSEAQLAADSAALAGARVLANSGATSASDTTVGTNAVTLASAVATQVAASSLVGGRNLNPGASPCVAGQEICVNINTGAANFLSNPQVTVTVQRTDLPTFFARIWGQTTVTVKATAIAEAYNPSNVGAGAANPALPVAPKCVKPWLLPNIDPSNSPNPIFDPVTGAIQNYGLLGWETPTAGGPGAIRLRSDCTTATPPPFGTPAPCASTMPLNPLQFMAGTTDPTDPTSSFPAPSASSVVCPGCTGFTNYQLSVAGCVQPPISCNSTATIDTVNVIPDNTETRLAVDGLTHTTSGNGGDRIDTGQPTGGPFQFVAEDENPVVLSGAMSAGQDIMVSDSLVTVPVFDSTVWPPATFPAVNVIGFIQLFLNPTGAAAPGSGHIHAKVVNLVGCGTGIVASPVILGNGASPVAVRLISQ